MKIFTFKAIHQKMFIKSNKVSCGIIYKTKTITIKLIHENNQNPQATLLLGLTTIQFEAKNFWDPQNSSPG